MSGNSGEYGGGSGDFGYWHQPMFSVKDSYFNFKFLLTFVLDEKYYKKYGDGRTGIRLILITKDLRNNNLLLKSRKFHNYFEY